ncbi:hypothetical protein BTJ68_06793 [Hortaea werneckii EXF-2000]|uniref:Nitroreductase domain-containing protein n=2 Tax=Hortaea werneckii TaxID=91943 RepID=A0A3M7HU16_HORWE|nr:hypothetical protein BTJ68_06793 [Hortaea werneckii EXF-2000]RMZ16840.1 hypothetical protein D0860_00779 [Hortaea werneckii]RMZ33249.1 hypothetical protein D0859_02606 [Hortaea werneckii]
MRHHRSIGAIIATFTVLALAYLLALHLPLYEKMAAPLLLRSTSSTISRLLPRFNRLSAPLLRPATTSTFSLQHPLNPTTTTPRPFTSTMSPSSAETMSFKDAIHLRRSIYALNKQSPIADTKIEEIVRTALKEVPSSFNSQSTRLVVLLKDDHDKFWDIVRDILKAHVPEDKWEHTGNRIKGFRGGYGTILFYEDPEPIKALQTKLPTYADKFPTWSEHTSAMHQYMLWTALEAEGFGCNLQHYNPLPDQKASAEWKIPLEWSLKAQLVFGGVEEGAREALKAKDEVPMAERLFVHGASS